MTFEDRLNERINYINSIKDKKIPENYKLTEEFINQVEALDVKHHSSIIETIISIQTDNQINEDGHNQGKGQAYQDEPLLGLYKSHCIDVSLQSTVMNMQTSKEGIKINYDNGFDVDFTKAGEKKAHKAMQEAISKGISPQEHIHQYTRKLFKNCLDNYNGNKRGKCIKGNWVLFGKSAGANIFLYTHVSFKHSRANDSKIYQQLIDMYSQEFISELKSGK